MELRSGRSKSKTPIHSFNYDQKIIEGENHIGQTVITRKSTTTTKTEYMGDIDNIVSYNHESSVKPSKLKSSKSEKAVRKTRYKTSDYSSEDGEPQITSTYYYDQNSANEFFEEPSRSVSRSSGSQVSALDFYRAAGDYWNKYPKTDYTYSLNSKDRTEIAPGVVAMPNMSRKSLHNFNSNSDYISTDKYTSTDYDESYDTRYVSKSMYTAKPRTLFSNNGYSTTTTVKKKSFLKIFTVFTSIFSWISTLVYYIYKTQNSAVLWVAKKIHTAATKVMLWDTWILQSFREKRKLSLLLLLCFLPLLLLGGLHVLLASGVPLTPPCHPHCGRIASSYINTLIDSAYNTLHNFTIYN